MNIESYIKLPTYKELDRIKYKLYINNVELILKYYEEFDVYLNQIEIYSHKNIENSVAICFFDYSLHRWKYSVHLDRFDTLFKVMYRLLEEDIPMIIKTKNHCIEFELNSIQYQRVMDKHRNNHV